MKRGSAWEERKEGGRGREKWRKVGKGERERGRMVTPNDYRSTIRGSDNPRVLTLTLTRTFGLSDPRIIGTLPLPTVRRRLRL